MEATIRITLDPQNAVPQDPAARVAWLNRYGAPSSSATLHVTLPLSQWLECGCRIEANGSVWAGGDAYYTTCELFREAALKWYAETGEMPKLDDPNNHMEAIIPTVIAERKKQIAVEQTKREERVVHLKRLLTMPIADFVHQPWSQDWENTRVNHRLVEWRAYKEEQEHQAQAEKRRARDAELAPVRAWIEAHGSSRLKKVVAAGLLDESLPAYRDERLAVERPGWQWCEWNHDDIRNPSEAALDALLEAHKSDPVVELVSLNVHSEKCAETEGVCIADEDCGRHPGLVSEFLDKEIMKFV